MPTQSFGAPLPILALLENGRFKVDVEVIDTVFDKVGNRPFAIISVNGAKRTGKSLLLNYFVKYFATQGNGNWIRAASQSPFVWEGGCNRVTIGIDIWSEPFLMKRQDGKEIAVLLMDTQGSFDDMSTVQQNATIFSLSYLLSSVFIYNVSKDVGEDTFQFIENFSLLLGSNVQEERFLPKLTFILRDFQSIRDYKYGYYDDASVPEGQPQQRNLKIERLNPRLNQPLEVQSTHENVLSNFRRVGIYAMPYPGIRLATLDDTSNLEPDFENHLKQFVELMLSENHLALKETQNGETTGTQFKNYFRACVQMLESVSESCQLTTVVQATKTSTLSKAKGKSMALYHKRVNNFLKKCDKNGPANEELQIIHEMALESALKLFQDMSHGFSGSEGEELRAEILECYKLYEGRNAANQRLRQNQILQAKIAEDESKRKQQVAMENSLKNDLQSLRTIYQSTVLILEEMSLHVELLTRNTLIAKTTAVSVGGVAAGAVVAGWIVSLAFAPLTFGASLGFGMALTGAAVGVASSLTFGGTNIVKSVQERNLALKLEDVVKKQEERAVIVAKSLASILALAKKISDADGIPLEDALMLVIVCIKKGMDVKAPVKEQLDFIDDHVQAFQMEAPAGDIGLVAAAAIRAAGIGLAPVIDDIIAASIQAGAAAVTRTAAQAVLQGVAAGAAVVFTAIDIVRLVRDFKENNPIGVMITELSDHLQVKIELCDSIVALLDTVAEPN